MATATVTATASGTTGSSNTISNAGTATATGRGIATATGGATIGIATGTATGTLKITLTQVDDPQTVSLYGTIYFYDSDDPKAKTTVFNVTRNDAVSMTVGNEIPLDPSKTDPLRLKSTFTVYATLTRIGDNQSSDKKICEGDANFPVGDPIPKGKDIPPQQGSSKITVVVTWT